MEKTVSGRWVVIAILLFIAIVLAVSMYLWVLNKR